MKQEFRLTRSIDFKRVRRSGRSYAHPLAVVIVGKGEAENTRVGFIVTRSVGNAVQRNRIKRQLREIFSHSLPDFLGSADILIIAREPIRNASFQEIESSVFELLRRAKLIVSSDHDTGRPARSY